MKIWRPICGVVTATLAVLFASVPAAYSQQPDGANFSLDFPGNQRMLQLRVEAPESVRVRNDFEYDIHVTNTTDNVILRDVQIAQESSKGVEIEAAHVGAQSNEQKKSDKKQSAKKQKQAEKKQQQAEKKQQQAEKQQQQAEKKQQSSQSRQKTWTINELKPGETKVIHVTAASDKEGQAEMCLMVKSYTPALCFTTNVVKPQLDLVMKTPEEAIICQPFEIEYFVRNPGSGDLKKLQLNVQLPEGLELTNGKKSIEFPIDGLEAEGVRKFVANVVARKAGEFSTRATATAPNDLKARSEKRSIKIRAPQLAVAVNGPDRVYLERDATYTLMVTNHGDAPARDATLMLHFPQSAGLVSTGQIQDTEEKVAKKQQGKAKSDAKSKKGEQKKQAETKTSSSEYADETWEIGALQPGETKMVQVTLSPSDAEKMQLKAVATHICGPESKSEEVTAMANTATEVISVPALAIAVVDEQDPVGVDQEVTYRVVLKNEGTAPAKDLNVRINLPEELSFISAEGPTKADTEEQSVKFKTVKTLNAGDEVTWQLRVKAEKSGDVRFPVHVTSKQSEQPIKAEEPTRLIKR